jgi:uncharacterized OsmC-like protein
MHVVQTGPLRFVARTGIGIVTEPGPAPGEVRATPEPPEYFLASLGACTAVRVQLELARRNSAPVSLGVTIDGTCTPASPGGFESIHLAFTLAGTLDEATVADAIREVVTRRLPIAVMMGGGVRFTWEQTME